MYSALILYMAVFYMLLCRGGACTEGRRIINRRRRGASGASSIEGSSSTYIDPVVYSTSAAAALPIDFLLRCKLYCEGDEVAVFKVQTHTTCSSSITPIYLYLDVYATSDRLYRE
jgi:hypothetical protein